MINGDDALAGIITFDDVHDVIEKEATEDFHRMGSISQGTGTGADALVDIGLRDASPWLLIRKRPAGDLCCGCRRGCHLLRHCHVVPGLAGCCIKRKGRRGQPISDKMAIVYAGADMPPKMEKNNSSSSIWITQPMTQTPTARSVLL